MTILQVADHHMLDLPPSYDHMDRSYAYGYQEPRYPVPAIPYRVLCSYKWKDIYIIDERTNQSVKNMHYPYA